MTKNPSSTLANENLIKVYTTNSFLDYWLTSTIKKIILVSLLGWGLIFYSTIATFAPNLTFVANQIPASNDNYTVPNLLANGSVNSAANQSSTSKVKAADVSLNSIVLIAILALILLAPMIKEAKISLQSIEFTMAEGKA